MFEGPDEAVLKDNWIPGNKERWADKKGHNPDQKVPQPTIPTFLTIYT